MQRGCGRWTVREGTAGVTELGDERSDYYDRVDDAADEREDSERKREWKDWLEYERRVDGHFFSAEEWSLVDLFCSLSSSHTYAGVY